MNPTRRQIEMSDSWEETDPLAAAADGEEKRKFPAAEAIAVARDLVQVLAPVCLAERLKVCGSLRRRKAMVGDIELVFVPQLVEARPAETDLLGTVVREAAIESRAWRVVDALLDLGVLSKRPKKDGTFTWGPWNRLAVHVASEVPVDFFSCTEEAWWNVVVSRTGGSRNNVEICSAAIAKGWRWNPSPTKPGFRRMQGLSEELHAVHSEEEVFRFVGMPYRRPEERS